MATATTSQKHAKLKGMAKTAKKNIFTMLRLADEILKDTAYVDQFGGEGRLIEMMEADEFSVWAGSPGLPAMLKAYRTSSHEATWKEHHYNLQAMIDISLPAREGEDRVRVNWKARCKEAEAKVEQLEASLADYKEMTRELRAKVDALTAENGELRGCITTLHEIRKEKAA